MASACFMTSSLTKESQESLEKLATKIIMTRGKKIKKWSHVLDLISKTEKFQYNVWDLFYFNERLVLSFTSSVVIFTVLAVQIISLDISFKLRNK